MNATDLFAHGGWTCTTQHGRGIDVCTRHSNATIASNAPLFPVTDASGNIFFDEQHLMLRVRSQTPGGTSGQDGTGHNEPLPLACADGWSRVDTIFGRGRACDVPAMTRNVGALLLCIFGTTNTCCLAYHLWRKRAKAQTDSPMHHGVSLMLGALLCAVLWAASSLSLVPMDAAATTSIYSAFACVGSEYMLFTATAFLNNAVDTVHSLQPKRAALWRGRIAQIVDVIRPGFVWGTAVLRAKLQRQHKAAVSLSLLYAAFVLEAGLKRVGARATTAEVCKSHIMPATQGLACAYYDLIWRDDALQRVAAVPKPDQWAGASNFFLCAPSSYRFRDLMDIIETFEKQTVPGKTLYYWFDVFVMNQHSSALLAAEFVPPKERVPGSQRAQAELLKIEDVFSRGRDKEGDCAAINACCREVRAVLAEVAASADRAQLRAVVQSEGTHHREAYAACHQIVTDDPGHGALLACTAEASARHTGVGSGGQRTCQQGTRDLAELYVQARAVLPAFAERMQLFAARFAHLRAGKHDAAAVSLHVAPLKHLYRCMEKMCLKASAQQAGASRVCDIVRCIIECHDCGLMMEVLMALLRAEGDICVARVKDRANHLTSMNWMDVMVNVTLVGDESAHVCEIQIVHSKMLVARASLGGHGSYAKLRAADEMLGMCAAGAHDLGSSAVLVNLLAVVRAHKRLLLPLDSWREPTPLSRVWCLLEIFTAACEGAELVTCLSSAEQSSFAENLQENHAEVQLVLEGVNARCAEATEEGDRGMIWDIIRAGAGFSDFNRTVVDALRHSFEQVVMAQRRL
eukprot:g7323.t1